MRYGEIPRALPYDGLWFINIQPGFNVFVSILRSIMDSKNWYKSKRGAYPSYLLKSRYDEVALISALVCIAFWPFYCPRLHRVFGQKSNLTNGPIIRGAGQYEVESLATLLTDGKHLPEDYRAVLFDTNNEYELIYADKDWRVDILSDTMSSSRSPVEVYLFKFVSLISKVRCTTLEGVPFCSTPLKPLSKLCIVLSASGSGSSNPAPQFRISGCFSSRE